MRIKLVLLLVIFSLQPGIDTCLARTPEATKALEGVGIPSTNAQRGILDTIGYAFTARQMDAVLKQGSAAAEAKSKELAARYGWNKDTQFIATVYPHDDHYYTHRMNSLWLPYLKAKRIILFGVFHKARWFDTDNKLVFDSFKTWHGPYGPVPVSSLREQLLEGLPASDYLIDNDAHMIEHSIEAIVPFLQAKDKEVEIVPVLVPYMDFKTIEVLSDHFSTTLSKICKRNGWKLGEDIALMISTDAVHYGDPPSSIGWNHDFGCSIDGYIQAVNREKKIISNYLTGPVQADKLKNFLYTCVDSTDVRTRKITWCGRFSTPFGLMVAQQITSSLLKEPLVGYLLDYSTSVEEASLDVTNLKPLGTTSPNNLHHWVGYPVIGYLKK